MNIQLKLVPTFTTFFSIEKNFLRAPVSLSYESRDGSYVYTLSDGLSIVGKQNIESKMISYYIGGTCSYDQLNTFITLLEKNLQCSIIFNDGESDTSAQSMHTITYNPIEMLWIHRSDSISCHCGGTIQFKLSQESLKQFKETFNTYKKLAFTLIEGHKMLQNQ